jgi:hypothetical protein
MESGPPLARNTVAAGGSSTRSKGCNSWSSGTGQAYPRQSMRAGPRDAPDCSCARRSGGSSLPDAEAQPAGKSFQRGRRRLLPAARDGRRAAQPGQRTAGSGPAAGRGHRRVPGRAGPGRLPDPRRGRRRSRLGAIAVGDQIQVGQTVQFQVQDAQSADEDLRRAMEREAAQRFGAR